MLKTKKFIVYFSIVFFSLIMAIGCASPNGPDVSAIDEIEENNNNNNNQINGKIWSFQAGSKSRGGKTTTGVQTLISGKKVQNVKAKINAVLYVFGNGEEERITDSTDFLMCQVKYSLPRSYTINITVYYDDNKEEKHSLSIDVAPSAKLLELRKNLFAISSSELSGEKTLVKVFSNIEGPKPFVVGPIDWNTPKVMTKVTGGWVVEFLLPDGSYNMQFGRNSDESNVKLGKYEISYNDFSDTTSETFGIDAKKGKTYKKGEAPADKIIPGQGGDEKNYGYIVRVDLPVNGKIKTYLSLFPFDESQGTSAKLYVWDRTTKKDVVYPMSVDLVNRFASVALDESLFIEDGGIIISSYSYEGKRISQEKLESSDSYNPEVSAINLAWGSKDRVSRHGYFARSFDCKNI